MQATQVKRVALAYSGGLDTTVMVYWLREKFGCEVVAYCADLGQEEELASVRQRALKIGVKKVIIEDLRNEFIKDYIWPSLAANALYEGQYPMATSLGRPLIAKRLIDVAKKYHCDAVAHGSTGKGNDQVRFEVSFRALAPEIKVLAPVRTWEFKTRDEEIEYAEKMRIPITVSKKKPYSLDRNLWGLSCECGVLEDPNAEPPEDIHKLTTDPLRAPAKPQYLTLSFKRGIPYALNGKTMPAYKLITTVEKLAGRHGVGRIDMVENRLVGIKSRETYEAPAAVVFHLAHRALEAMCLDRETAHYKDILSLRYADLVYYGHWFSPLRRALDAFNADTQQVVNGDVRIKLYRGSATVVGRTSPTSLYSLKLATYDKGDKFDQKLAEGFNRLWGLPLEVAGIRDRKGRV
ncbi:MAG TPA: argininosuccinate synthase [bacterium]|nr:argininosuccinate synthase [bacterium]